MIVAAQHHVAAKASLIEAHRPRWTTFKLWLLFSGIFIATEAALVVAVRREMYWLAVPLVFVAAHFMHSQLMAFHESAHNVFCPKRWLNEAIGIFLGVFHFSSLSLFRAVHHTHHAHLGTEQDEQLWPFVHPHVPRWQRRLAAVLELTFGMFYDAFLFWRSFFRPNSSIRSPRVRRRIWMELALMIGVWTAMFTVTSLLGTGKMLVWMYVAPALLTGSLYAWRKYVEHMGLTGDTPGQLSRSVVHTDPLGRVFTFTMYNIGFHAVHHAYSAMPQDALPQFVGALDDDDHAGEVVFPNYYSALRAMIPTLADPKVGPQWRRAGAIAEN